MTLTLKRLRKAAVALSLSLVTQSAFASGYQINEYSATGLGRAFAGEAAMADNASTNARNPAALFLLKSTSVSLGLTYVDPEVDIDVIDSTAGPTDKGELNDGAGSETIPNFHITSFVTDNFAIGYSATATFGLSTDYGSEIAGPVAGKTSLSVINHNINGAYKISDAWSLGLGVNAAYADASLTRYNLDGSVAGKLEGDDWGYGWNAGFLYQLDENNRFGFTYRSEIDLNFTGSLNTLDAKMPLTLPETYEFSGFHQITEALALHYSVARTNWSCFKKMNATTNNPAVSFTKEENWSDTWRLALGTTYRFNPEWTLRAGFAYDESPVGDENRTMSIPDTDRYWWTLGTSYTPTQNWNFDFGFAYLSGKEHESSTEEYGPLTYTYDSTGDAFIYGLQASYLF